MRNEFHRMLSIRGTDFIACWACAEMFKSRISRPNRIRFSKISCYRPLGPYGFGFCKKSQKKNSCLWTFKVTPHPIEPHLTLLNFRSCRKMIFLDCSVSLYNFIQVFQHNNNYFTFLLVRFTVYSKACFVIFKGYWTSMDKMSREGYLTLLAFLEPKNRSTIDTRLPRKARINS